jgi:hypothetical protein
MRRPAATVVGLALTLLAAPLAAQDTVQVIGRDTVQVVVQDPAPAAMAHPATPVFRRGQWAGLFRMGGTTYGAGAMKFSTPEKAWTYLGSVTYNFENAGVETRSIGGNVQIGRRTYSAPRGRVRSFRQLGGQAGLGHAWTSSSGPEQSSTTISLGAHGIIGATIFVASDLSIGAEWIATAGFTRQYVDSPFAPDDPSDSWGIDAGLISVSGALYF